MLTHISRRPLAAGLLVLAVSACGPLVGSPNPTPTPLPTSKLPLLRKQARDLKSSITRVTHVYSAGVVTARDVLDDHKSACYFHDPDDPVLGGTTLNWEYAVRVEFGGPDRDGAHELAFENALRADGWRLGTGFGQLVAVKKGMYLEILTTRGTGGPSRPRRKSSRPIGSSHRFAV
jgi:hypothetical protein